MASTKPKSPAKPPGSPQVGRPPKYDPAYPAQLVRHMAEGLSFESFAAVVGTSRRVLYDWEKRYPEFLHAKENGLAASLLFWEDVAIKGALGRLKAPASETLSTDPITGLQKTTTKYRPAVFNAAACIFTMKNRFPDLYRDRQDLHHHDAGRDDLADRTPEEIMDQAEKIMARMRDSRGKGKA